MRTFARPETTYFRIPTRMSIKRKSKKKIQEFCKSGNRFCQISKKHKGCIINISYGIMLNDNMTLNSEINAKEILGAIYS